MGSEKDLTIAQKEVIIYGYLRGDSYRVIAANVGCKKSSVGNIIGKYRKAETTEPQRKRPGRPPLLTASDRSALKTLVTNGNRHLNAAQVATTFTAQTKLRVSKKTIRRALKKENLRSCIARPKPLISTINALNRLTWCLARRDWTARHFRRILWSDETSIQLFQQVLSRIWREPHEEWDAECLSCTVKRSPSRMTFHQKFAAD
jgi:transposase